MFHGQFNVTDILRESNSFLTIIPRARMGCESIAMRPKAKWSIDSEAITGERNNCFSKIKLVGQKYRDKTTLAG